MDYTFTQQCKDIAKDGFKEQEKNAYESIINFLFRMKLYGKEKARQIDEYDGESLFGRTTLYPGQIYSFIYKADKPNIYNDGNISFEYYDSLPIILVTHIEAGKVRGINLNLCNFDLRVFILNALHNLDPEFFKRTNLDMANSGKMPISNNVTKVFLNPESEKAFIQYIVNECKLRNPGILYRTYNVNKIKEIRMLEIWQHKYIPFLTYTGELKKNILDIIHKITGVDQVHI